MIDGAPSALGVAPRVDGADRDPTPRGQRDFAIGLAVITAFGLALRLAYVWFVWKDRELGGDPVFYHVAANLLADGRGFINPYLSFEGLSVPAADHPPLYTAYLGLFSFLGVRSVVGHMVVSCLVGAAAVAVTGLLGRRVAGPRVGLIAAVLVAIYPNTWRYDAMVLSETLVGLVVVLTLLFAHQFWDRPGTGRIALVGLGLALCALARSELLLLSLFLVVPLVLLRSERSWRTRLSWITVAAAVCIAALAPWVGHNLARFDRPVLLSGQLESTLTVANCDTTYYGPLLGYWDYACGGRILDRRGVTTAQQDGTVEDVLLEETLDYMSEQRGRIPVVMAVRFARIVNLWSPTNAVDLDAGVDGHPVAVAWAAHVTFWPIAFAAAIGVLILRRRHVPVFALLAPLTVVLFTAVFIYATPRFRVAAEGALCVLAAVAMSALWGRIRPQAGSNAPARPSTGARRPLAVETAPSEATGSVSDTSSLVSHRGASGTGVGRYRSVHQRVRSLRAVVPT